ncbi:MAG: dipeptide epimerase [Bacteroidota bacterium]
MQLRYTPYTLELKHQFTIATSTRSTTPVVLTEIEHDDIIGYGEASLPPYLGETQRSVSEFFAHLNLDKYSSPSDLEAILTDVDGLAPGNHAAKAALDIALHDWIGKKVGQSWHGLLGLDPRKSPYTSFTIGIDTKDVIRRKVEEAREFRILKVKLGREDDGELIETIREMTDVPLRVDINQGWNDREEALRKIEWLATQGIELVEQPFPRERLDDHAWLKERSPLPIVADEAIVRLSDIRNAVGVYDGINIKLMKCTGMREAYRMMGTARALGLKVMLGCMTETSCAISAAAQLASLADWADLDGALLIKNDPFTGATLEDGRIVANHTPGIGATKIERL